MSQPIQTHINAFYADLTTAKQEAAAAAQKVVLLEEAIVARGHQLPNSDGSFDELEEAPEAVATSDDVSAAEEKPVKAPVAQSKDAK